MNGHIPDRDARRRWLPAAALLLAAAALLPGQAALAAAGKVLFVTGPVTVERPAPAELRKGDPIEVGDVIVTGEKARAQLLMNDGARIALRSGTRYRVDEFRLPPAVGTPTAATTTTAGGSYVATLLKGGFRTATGAIGKDGGAGYEVRTPVGTLGIRGTDYATVSCRGDCDDAPGAAPGVPPPDGLYLGVFDGSIVFRYPGGELVLVAGQFAFIPYGEPQPELLQQAPRWLLEDGAGPLNHGASGGRDSAASVLVPGLADRRSPTAPPDSAPPADGSAVPGSTSDSQPGSKVNRPVTGTSFGQQVDLTDGQLPVRNPSGPGQQQDTAPPSSAPPPGPTRPPGGNGG